MTSTRPAQTSWLRVRRWVHISVALAYDLWKAEGAFGARVLVELRARLLEHVGAAAGT